MDNRSFESGAAASPPAAPASPSVGHPTAGDPQAAVPATKPGPYWFYQLGEELRAVLAAAGITPDKANLTQLLTALRSAGVFTTPSIGDRTTKAATMACFSQEFGSSIAANGYQKLPSGLIIQWGSSFINVNYGTPINFPVAFPNGCLAIVIGDVGAGNVNMSAGDRSSALFYFYTASPSGYTYIALGF